VPAWVSFCNSPLSQRDVILSAVLSTRTETEIEKFVFQFNSTGDKMTSRCDKSEYHKLSHVGTVTHVAVHFLPS
jgi:hypothetical protein